MSSQTVPSPTDVEMQGLFTMMQQIHICDYVIISALTFILYDIMINMDKEIAYVWNYCRNDCDNLHIPIRMKVWQIVIQFLFILGRYYGLVFLTWVGSSPIGYLS
ncbi:hypothetical protein BDN67DRAFT_1008104 [Paxillus ammoniavirescens]|nr:hypothetical protein BDN67DRAFT_1008104 [Paxillus ammoniavirescens]